MVGRIGCAASAILTAVGLLAGFIALLMWGLPVYSVWNAGQAGQAELAQANYNRQTQVVSARANMEAQQYNADSEVIRGRGVAAANNIVKASISDQYIRYLWVQTLDKQDHSTIIYVPTEGGIPVMEAGRGTSPPPAAPGK